MQKFIAMKFTREGVEVSLTTLLRIQYVLTVLGVALGTVGIADAYQRVGLHSPAGFIITSAIAVATASILGLFVLTHRITRRNR